jgi:hypothetical protein
MVVRIARMRSCSGNRSVAVVVGARVARVVGAVASIL